MTRIVAVVVTVFWVCSVSAKAPVAFDDRPFDTNVMELPKRYPGVDALRLIVLLEKRPTRGEFEKTSDFEGRLAAWNATPLVGRIWPRDTIAVVTKVTSLRREYDADEGVMTFSFGWEQVHESWGRPHPQVLLEYSSKKHGSYIATNAYGARARVTRSEERAWYLRFGGSRMIWQKYPIEVPPREAKEWPDWRLVFVGRLSDKPSGAGTTETTPTIDDPLHVIKHEQALVIDQEEVWFVHWPSGRIIRKFFLE